MVKTNISSIPSFLVSSQDYPGMVVTAAPPGLSMLGYPTISTISEPSKERIRKNAGGRRGEEREEEGVGQSKC